MAHPQKEDGYTIIANEIIEALAKTKLCEYETRVLCVILRRTYGWRKKEDGISLKQFAKMTHIGKPHIIRTLKRLIQRKIITHRGNKNGITYGLQKDYDKWIPLPLETTVAYTGNNRCPQRQQMLPIEAINGVVSGKKTDDLQRRKESTKRNIQKKQNSVNNFFNADRKFERDFIREWNAGVVKAGIGSVRKALGNDKSFIDNFFNTTEYTSDDLLEAVRKYWEKASDSSYWSWQYFPKAYTIKQFFEKEIAVRFCDPKYIEELESHP